MGNLLRESVKEVSGLMAEAFWRLQLEAPHLPAQTGCSLRLASKEISKLWANPGSKAMEFACSGGGSRFDCLPTAIPSPSSLTWSPEFVQASALPSRLGEATVVVPLTLQ